MKTCLFLLILLAPLNLKAQQTAPAPPGAVPARAIDTLRAPAAGVLRPDQLAALEAAKDTLPVTIATKQAWPVPRKATIYSLVIPGAGQIYNRDYWKLPFVYGAFGGAIYTIHWNTVRYKDFLEPYLSSVDPATGQPTGQTEFPVYIRRDGETINLTLDQIKRGKTFYRRYREYGFVILGLVYALAAVEANVAAHLKTFNANMNDDLSLRLEPSDERTAFSQPAPGLKLVLAFK